MAKIRTFVAAAVSQRVRNNVGRVIQKLAACDVAYNWVLNENLHITLNFVGDVVDVEIPELCNLIKKCVEGFAPFELSVQGVGAFPDNNRPRIIWMGVEEGTDQLKAINQEVAEVLSVWGVNKDRNDFVPHMTLGRLRRGGRWNEKLLQQIHQLRNHDAGFCTVDRVIVYSSYLDRSGPTYTPMSTISLQG